MIKHILKLIGGLLLGCIIGIAFAAIIVVLFTDLSLSDYLLKLRNIELGEGILSALVAIAALLISLPIQVILHEGGHLVCGLMSGYQFVSFRIFNFTFIRKDGKLIIKKYAVAGTGGQCLLSPPERKLEEIPVVWYNLGGVLANVIAVLAVLPLLWVVNNPFLYEVIFIFFSLGVFFILMNGIPMKMGGISNDAYNVFLLRKDKESKRALMVQLRANACLQRGMRPKEMPREWFSTATPVSYKNPLQLFLYILDATWLLDNGEWEEAHQLFKEAYFHRAEIIGLYQKEIACELLFTSLVTGHNELANELYTDDLKKYITQFRKVMSSKERVICAVSLYLEKDKEKAYKIYNNICLHQEDYLMQGEVKSDIALMSAIL